MNLNNFLKKSYFAIIPSITPKQERETGMVMVIICLVAALFYPPELFVKIALVITLFTLTISRIFYPFSIIWLLIGKILSLLSTYIILTLLFFIMVVPMGVIRRIFKKDTLRLDNFKKGTESVFIHRNHIFEPLDIKYPF